MGERDYRPASKSRPRDLWLDTLATLHGVGAAFLMVCQVADQDVGLVYVWFAIVAAIIAWGLWFRRSWIPGGVLLVYGFVGIVLPVLTLVVFLRVETGNWQQWATAILVNVMLQLWMPAAVVAGGIMLWSMFGRRGRSIFHENSGSRFTLHSLFVWMTLLSLMLAGIMKTVAL